MSVKEALTLQPYTLFLGPLVVSSPPHPMVSRPSGLLSYFFLLALSQGMCPEVGEEGGAGLSSQRVWGGLGSLPPWRCWGLRMGSRQLELLNPRSHSVSRFKQGKALRFEHLLHSALHTRPRMMSVHLAPWRCSLEPRALP